jgi:hypothetical protein
VTIQPGDKITTSGLPHMVPSGRRWWQFWKPRMVESHDPQALIVTTVSSQREMCPEEKAEYDAYIASLGPDDTICWANTWDGVPFGPGSRWAK